MSYKTNRRTLRAAVVRYARAVQRRHHRHRRRWVDIVLTVCEFMSGAEKHDTDDAAGRYSFFSMFFSLPLLVLPYSHMMYNAHIQRDTPYTYVKLAPITRCATSKICIDFAEKKKSLFNSFLIVYCT